MTAIAKETEREKASKQEGGRKGAVEERKPRKCVD